MAKKASIHLGRRERQIMDAVYQLGEATVNQVRDQLADPPSYSAVRAMLSILEQKGFLKHRQEKLRFIYVPTVPHQQARHSAIQHLLQTFFGGSSTQAVAALLDRSVHKLSAAELEELAALIDKARKKGR